MAENEVLEGKLLKDVLKKVEICNKFVEGHPDCVKRTQSIVCGAMNCDRVTPRQIQKVLRAICRR